MNEKLALTESLDVFHDIRRVHAVQTVLINVQNKRSSFEVKLTCANKGLIGSTNLIAFFLFSFLHFSFIFFFLRLPHFIVFLETLHILATLNYSY